MDEDTKATLMNNFFRSVSKKAHSTSLSVEERLPFVQLWATMEVLTVLVDIRDKLNEERSLPHEDAITENLKEYLFRDFE